MHNRFLLLAIIFIAIESKSFSQVVPQNHSISIQPAYGSHILKNENGIFHDYIYGVDISYLKDISNNSDLWIKKTNAKAYGLSVVMRNLNNLKGPEGTSNNSFGQAYGITGIAQFEVIKVGPIRVNFSPAVGLSYVTKSYFSNPKNRFIGSNINMTIKADLGVEIPVKSNLSLSGGINTLHYSNGGFNIPNGGLNTGGLYAGLTFKNFTDTTSKKSAFISLQKNSFDFEIGIGRRGVYESHKGIFRSGVYAGYNCRLNDVFTLKSGIDAVYTGTVYDPSNRLATFQYYGSSFDSWRTGISLGTDLNMGRVAVNLKAGKYVHFARLYKTTKNINWYWTFGPTYYITPRIGVQFKTYMHLAQADFQNWGLVVKI